MTEKTETEDTTMKASTATALESGVLNSKDHARIVQNIDSIAKAAHIPKHMIWTSTKGICGEYEIKYMRKYRQQSLRGNQGLVFSGKNITPDHAHLRMMALAGMCLRNNINAEIMTITQLLDDLREGVPVTKSAIMIPNFHVTGEGGALLEWQKQQLLDFLLCRHGEIKQQTFLYVRDFKAMAKDYGDVLVDQIENNYKIVTQ